MLIFCLCIVAVYAISIPLFVIYSPEIEPTPESQWKASSLEQVASQNMPSMKWMFLGSANIYDAILSPLYLLIAVIVFPVVLIGCGGEFLREVILLKSDPYRDPFFGNVSTKLLSKWRRNELGRVGRELRSRGFRHLALCKYKDQPFSPVVHYYLHAKTNTFAAVYVRKDNSEVCFGTFFWDGTLVVTTGSEHKAFEHAIVSPRTERLWRQVLGNKTAGETFKAHRKACKEVRQDSDVITIDNGNWQTAIIACERIHAQELVQAGLRDRDDVPDPPSLIKPREFFVA